MRPRSIKPKRSDIKDIGNMNLKNIYKDFKIDNCSNKARIKNRSDLINFFIRKNKYKKYLEIGCYRNVNFKRIRIEEKTGVDSVRGGNIRLNSDDFFDKNNKKFDIVFVDGLHHYYQVKRDIENALKFLNEGGVIIVHDCLPQNEGEQIVPQNQSKWTGDVWKAICHFRQRKDLDVFVLDIDHGCGIISKQKNLIK